MNMVSFSYLEAKFVSRNILKTLTILESQAGKDPQILERRTYKTLKTLVGKANQIQEIINAFGEEQYNIDVILSKNQKLILKQLAENTITALTTKILPVYVSRGLADYAKDAEEKKALLEKLVRKLK